MADTTISGLSNLSVSSGLLLPVSNGSTTGRVSIADINSLAPVQSVAGRTGAVVLTKTDVGLSNVENKSSATIRSEIVSTNLPAGTVIQVVQNIKTDINQLTPTGNTEIAIPGLSAQIIPTSSTSKILINMMFSYSSNGTTYGGYLKRNGVIFGIGNAGDLRQRVSIGLPYSRDTNQVEATTFTYLDTPNTTAPLTYQLFVINDNGFSIFVNRSVSDPNNTTGKRTISTFTLTEIAG